MDVKTSSKREKLSKQRPEIWENIHLRTGDALRFEISSQAAIVFVIGGSLGYKMEPWKDGIVEDGQMLIIPFGYFFCSKALEDSHLMVCRFSSETLFSLDCFSSDMIDPRNYTENNLKILFINKIMHSFLSFVCVSIQNGMVEKTFFEFTQRKLFILFSYVYPKQDLVAFFYPIVGKDIYFKKIVIDNFLKVKNVEELATLTRLSASGFRKRFIRCFNESPTQWIGRKKAQAIKTDILTGMMTLKEIACKYQFSSYGCFFDFCKTQFGVSPSQIENLRK